MTGDADDPARVRETEADAFRDLARDGWKIEGPFRACPKVAGLQKVWFIGFGLTRLIQWAAHHKGYAEK